MKKKIACLLSLLLLPILTSCEEDKVALTYGTYLKSTVYSIQEITTSQLFTKAKDEKEVFLLAVYQGEYSQDCLCWATFENVIAKYMNKYHELVYTYDGQTQDDSILSLKIDKMDASTPCLYVFNGEKNVKKFSYANKQDKAIFEDVSAEAMHTRLHKVIEKPTLYYVDYEYLDSNYASFKKSAVLFLRSGCGDCKYVLPNVIIPYIKRNVLATDILLFDMQEYYNQAKNESATEEEKKRYSEIKDRFGLSEKGNNTYGYEEGVVPTLQYIKDGQLESATVYFNDTIGKKEDGSFYIANSFYSDERLSKLRYLKGFGPHSVLKGMSVAENDVLTYDGNYYWSQAAANKYHKPLLEAFLDYYMF